MNNQLATWEVGIRDSHVTGANVVRWPEWAIIAFLMYSDFMAVRLPVSPEVRNLVLLVNSAVVLTYCLLIVFDSGRFTSVIGFIRDWLPLGLTVLAYREMGWLALPHPGHTLEARWVVWDRAVLHGGVKGAIEAFGPVLPSALEIAYSLVYALAPISIAVLYFYRRRARVDQFLFIFMLGTLLCYAQYPWWPSEPPRAVFFGQDAPAYDTIFRRFNWWMLGNYGIHTSVFPSGHVAAAFSTAFGMRQALVERKWVSRILFVMATLIAIATVYGRYHYIADAAAGFAIAALAFVLGALLQGTRRLVMTQPGASQWASADMPAANSNCSELLLRSQQSVSTISPILHRWHETCSLRFRNGDKPIMNIQRTECNGELLVQVEGRLAGVVVHELEDCWRTARGNLPDGKFSIDLERVTSIDRAGRSLLRLMHRHGVDFPTAGLAIRSILEQVSERTECRH